MHSEFRLHWFHVLTLSIFAGFWIRELVRLIRYLPILSRIAQVYEKLGISDAELETVRWADVLQRLIQALATSGRRDLPWICYDVLFTLWFITFVIGKCSVVVIGEGITPDALNARFWYCNQFWLELIFTNEVGTLMLFWLVATMFLFDNNQCNCWCYLTFLVGPTRRPPNVHDIVNRIMRKENYFIALFNKDLADIRVPSFFPLIGERVFNSSLFHVGAQLHAFLRSHRL